MEYHVLPVGAIAANCIILEGDGGKTWIVDPGENAKAIIGYLESKSLEPAVIVCTHGHFDHIGAIGELEEKYPSLAAHVGPRDEVMFGHHLNCWEPEYPLREKPPRLVADLTDGCELDVAGLKAKVIATPGHTPGGVCFHFENDNLLLSGDTLFAGSAGRTDFPGGSYNDLKASLMKLASLPAETTVVPGHGMKTTIGREMDTNPFLVDF